MNCTDIYTYNTCVYDTYKHSTSCTNIPRALAFLFSVELVLEFELNGMESIKYTHTNGQICICTYAYIRRDRHTHIHTNRPTHIHTYEETDTHTYIDNDTYT